MLVTIEQLRVAAGLDENDATQDATLNALYPIALALIENYCDRKFELAADEETFVHVAGYSVQLRRFPLVSIDQIGVDENSYEVKYHADNEAGIIQFDGRLISHVLTVDYTGGYDETTCPNDLQWALLRIFKLLYADASGDTSGITGPVKQAKIGDLQISFDTGNSGAGSVYDNIISPVLANILANYRRWTV